MNYSKYIKEEQDLCSAIVSLGTMSPSPRLLILDSSRQHGLSGEEVVVTGMSGLFPKSDNTAEFMSNLYNHVDMVEPNSSQKFQHPDLPKFMGKVNGWEKFDGTFFKVPHGQRNFIEGMTRKLLEQAYGAIFDAGINPGSKACERVSVFVGAAYADQTSINLYKEDFRTKNTYLLLGHSKTMMSNRISYWINGKLQSYTLDQNCASFTVCLEHAYWSIRRGLCDAAIVGSCNHCLHPMLSINLQRSGVLSSDGKTKCFDKHGNGFVRADACGVVFLQKAKDAKRIYCEVYYAKQKFFMGPELCVPCVRKPEDLEKFLQEFYGEIDVSPEMVEYIEANALGIAEADGNELQAIANIFGKNKAVKVGSVKSNMGHAEAASGLCSLVKGKITNMVEYCHGRAERCALGPIKICLANQSGKLPANLHYKKSQDDIQAVKDGRIQVVTENTPFNRSFVALNSFSFSGINVHVLLKCHYKMKNIDKYKSIIPRLVVASARTESCLHKLLNNFKNKSIDPEEIALLHNFYNIDISGHTTRGYVVLDTSKNKETITLSEGCQLYPGVRRPVWFMYSGMGSQWPAMGAALMHIPIFAVAIERCRKILEPKGVDIVRILTDPDETIFDNILNSFVGIAAMQIALTDILNALRIIPDNIIGHSVGELGCAYADGCFTADEMILASYYRGLVSTQTEFCKGSMAAVGLGYKDLLPICPSGIEIACHNSAQSCTVSGPSELVQQFVGQLKSHGVFAKEVNTSNIAYHSRCIAQAGGPLLSKMKEFIITPKLRSAKWLSTSVLPENWNKPEAQYCSAEYFTNNLLNPVYFEEVAVRIPPEAIVIEISPHGLMQAILKRSHSSCTHVPLTSRGHHDSTSFLLSAIGKLYEVGLNPKIDVLYPPVEFPVSTETPSLSHLVEWEHSDDWILKGYEEILKTTSSNREVILSVHDDEWSFIKDHVRDGVAVIPEAVIMFLVWETFGMYQGFDYKIFSVRFEDVEFRSTINALADDAIKLNINILKGSGAFQVAYEDLVVASGYIYSYNDKYITNHVDVFETQDSLMELKSKDFYTMMNVRGHSYGSKMRSIHSCNFKRNKALVQWEGDWVMFLDSLLQLSAFAMDSKSVVTPVYINNLIIDTYKHPNAHDEWILTARATYYESKQIVRCGGVVMSDIVLCRKPEIHKDKVVSLQVPFKSSNPQEIKLATATYGDFDKLVWVKNETISSRCVKISHAGISTRDCYRAMGSITDANDFGMDFSGVNDRKERVMGVVRGGAMATSVEADLDLLWPVPSNWSLEDAATVPFPYLLVYYTLLIKSHIMKWHNILIMDGACALGQAFISVCLDLGCNTFVSVSNIDEKKFLAKLFPKLKEKNIIDYRTTDINGTIASNNNQALCDVVVNCGVGGSLESGFKCVGAFGIFLDIIDLSERKVVGMDYFCAGKNISLVNVSNLFKLENLNEKRVLQARMGEGIARGAVRPLSRVVYSAANVSSAFRLASANISNGRVLIRVENWETVSGMLSSLEPVVENASHITFSANTKCNDDFGPKVLNILGLKKFDYCDERSIKDLHVNNILLEEIRALIHTTYEINYSREQLQEMTIPSLMSLGERYKKRPVPERGVRALFPRAERDECRAAEPLVLMHTAVNKHRLCDQTQMQIDSEDTYLFMIPGFRGHEEDFPSTLCERLKIQAVTFQTGLEFHEDDIPGMARRIMNIIQKTFNLKTKFYIVGYSFGINIALELAWLLEKEGHTGIVYCLDTSPDALKLQLAETIGTLNDEDLQNEIIKHMYNIFSGRDKDDLGRELKEIRNWIDKKGLCIKKLRYSVGYSSEYMECTIEGFYKKILAALDYKPNFKLKSELVLLKGKSSESLALAGDYGLGIYSVNPVRVFPIQSDFTTAPCDYRTANIINRLLEDSILKQFRQKNLCYHYNIQ